MATTITMPKLGLTMNSGSVKEWKKKIGDAVKKGELLYTVATDKLTVDVESPADGILLAITLKGDEEVPVGAPIAVIGNAGESVEAETKPASSREPLSDPVPEASNAALASPASGATPTQGRVIASPKAKKLARERGIDLSAIKSTGPGGWIVARDVLNAQPSSSVKISPVAARMAQEAGIEIPSTEPGKRVMKADVAAAIASTASASEAKGSRRVPMTQMRRIIGERMLQSVSSIPAVNYFVDVEMDALNKLRSFYNARLEGTGVKISINDILMKLCAKLLLENESVNASVEPDFLVMHDFVNIGFAVALPGGLIVPNVKDVQVKSLTQIAKERAELVEKARTGGLSPDNTTGGTFTISNLGMMGVGSFTPIINPPEAAILGVGTTTERPVVHSGEIVIRSVATLALTADHRLVDGADGAKFLSQLKELIEDPSLFLL